MTPKQLLASLNGRYKYLYNARQIDIEQIGTRVEALYLKSPLIENFSCLSSLKRLRHLEIAGFARGKVEDIARLTSLRFLSLETIPQVYEIEALSKLMELRVLILTTGMGEYKYHHIDSIKPLQKLKKLRALSLAGIKIDRDGTEPLRNIKTLQRLNLPASYAKDIEKLLMDKEGFKMSRMAWADLDEGVRVF